MKPHEKGTVNEDMEKLVARKLAELGSTEAEVVKTLMESGCTGEPEQELTCPAAYWLAAVVPETEDSLDAVPSVGIVFLVNCDTVTICEEPRPRIFRSVGSVLLPDPVRAFVKNFDEGEYPDLES